MEKRLDRLYDKSRPGIETVTSMDMLRLWGPKVVFCLDNAGSLLEHGTCDSDFPDDHATTAVAAFQESLRGVVRRESGRLNMFGLSVDRNPKIANLVPDNDTPCDNTRREPYPAIGDLGTFDVFSSPDFEAPDPRRMAKSSIEMFKFGLPLWAALLERAPKGIDRGDEPLATYQ